MSNFLMLVGCLVAGVLLRRSGRLPDQAHVAINGIIVHVSLPAVTLHYLHHFRFDGSLWWPIVMPWMLFVIAAAGFFVLGRLLRLPPATVGALTLVAGFGNTSFVGLPMIETLQGTDGVGLGVLIDQLGSYLALSTLGIAVATVCAAEGRLSVRSMARKVATFPPFIALVTALLLTGVPFAPVVTQTLVRIGDTLAPLALLSVGLQLRFDGLRAHRRLLCYGLSYKLLICPALVIGAMGLVGTESTVVSRVSVIEAAMPPMIGAAIVASQAALASPLVSLLVGLGIPIGLVTAPAWLWLFSVIAA